MKLDFLGNIYITGETNSLGPTNGDVFLLKYENIDPQIEIITPIPNQVYGNATFVFNLTFIEPNLGFTWYTLNGKSTKFFFTGNTGVIDQTAWDACGNGTVSLKFYANDTLGNVGHAEVLIQKENNLPYINILSPTAESFHASIPPDFFIAFNGNDINSTWYSLNNGQSHFFSGSSGSINQIAWDNCLDGKIVLNFYINDSSGWYMFDQVIINKDTSSPEISILFPIPNQLYGIKTVDFSLNFTVIYLDSIWYRLNEGESYFVPITNNNNNSNNNSSGTINQAAWDLCENGTVSIKFYINNSAGSLVYDEINIRKDNIGPEILILHPQEYNVIGTTAFNFSLMINEPNIVDTSWYTLDGGINNYSFSGLNGLINQSVWNATNNGVVHLRFYANDSLGNLAFKEIIIYKDFDLIPKRAYAIIVGVSDYPGTTNDLMYPRADAITMSTMLRAKYNFLPANIILLTNSEATKTAIFNAFTTIKNQMNSEDVFFFYYSGHGGEASSSIHFICPYDSIPSNPSKYIYDLELDNLLNQLPNAEKIVMIDACNSGGFISEVQAAHRFIMAASKATQLSWETSELRHGVFTYFFVDSIFVAPDSNGDGVLSLEEQFSYARSETTSYMLGWGELQQPTKYDGIPGQAVLFPSIGSLNLLPIGNELHYSFTIYGHGILNSLNITVSSVFQNTSIEIIDLRLASPSNTGFGHYSGIIQLENGLNVSGYEFIAEIQGYNLITFKETFGDTDNDGLNDILEIKNGMNPGTNDTDEDGLSDYDEYYGITNPLINDTDGDGILDGYEIFNDLNPLQNDALSDYDGDGLINILEYLLGSLANNIDTDNDGVD
ncbi:hypothetical protein LCGC14_1390120, partial [marine sediment metagenome]